MLAFLRALDECQCASVGKTLSVAIGYSSDREEYAHIHMLGTDGQRPSLSSIYLCERFWWEERQEQRHNPDQDASGEWRLLRFPLGT